MTGETKPSEYQVEAVRLSEQPALVVRATVGQDQLGSFIGGAFVRVREVAEADGTYVSGPPFARLGQEADGRLLVEAGFPVRGMLLGEGDVKASRLPGGRCCRRSTGVATAGAVLLPGVSLVPVLVLTQVLNAVLLLSLLVVMYRLSREPDVMWEDVVGTSALPYVATIGFVAVCVGGLLLLSLG